MLVKVKKEFSNLIKNYATKRYLVAASSGLDSTVLIHLCQELKLDFGICHCNFQLRGEESEGDQQFLEALAKDLKTPIYSKTENAKTYATKKRISIQEAAREIRYNWFDYCLTTHHYDVLLTAHHANDKIETFLINSFRGTGLRGLTGIPDKRESIARPLLNFSREELQKYAEENQISWRDDRSNESDNYLRNIFRHHLVPFFEDKGDDMFSRFNTTFKHLIRQHTLLGDYLEYVRHKIHIQKEPTLQISLKELQRFPNYTLLLLEVLRDYGFSDNKGVTNLINAQNGKTIYAQDFQITKERGFLELFEIEHQQKKPVEIKFDTIPCKIDFENGSLEFSEVPTFSKSSSEFAFLNKDKLTGKLILRPHKEGDYFYPLGMKGKRKLSDFLKDEKLTNFAKSKTWVLTHNNDIIWVVNHRIDDRYKLTKTTSTCLKVVFKPL